MQSTEQSEFEGLVARLCAGYGIPATDERQASFWTAFKVLSIIEFSRMVDYALSETGLLKGKPDVPAMWGVRTSMKARPQVFSYGLAARRSEPEQTFGLRLVNQMFFTYLMQRRVQQEFKGDIRMDERRQECRELADWIDGMKADDMLPTLGECMAAFGAAMKRVDEAVKPAELAES